MWETPFEESMLCKPLVIHCPDKFLADELMEILDRNGIMWGDGDSPTAYSMWGHYREETCYWVVSQELTCGSKCYVGEDDDEDDDYIKCTFYSEIESNFEPADNSELLVFLGL